MNTLARYPRGSMDRHELKRVMYSWPRIMGTITDEWAIEFSANVWERHSDPRWLPTVKQSHFMRMLYREHHDKNGESKLVEK